MITNVRAGLLRNSEMSQSALRLPNGRFRQTKAECSSAVETGTLLLPHVMGDHADAKERGIGCKLPAGHALHAKADFQFLDAVLGYLAALAIPHQCGFG